MSDLGVRLIALDTGDHDVHGTELFDGTPTYECKRCGRTHRSPESFEVEPCRDRHP